MEIKNLCVFTGSTLGARSEYSDHAEALADLFIKNNIGLVYGGGNVGLMGKIASRVLQKGGRVVGVIPQALYEKELGHEGVTQLHVVNSMHERKAMMARLSDGFIALPGGIGTLEEVFEVWSWVKLGLHNKPCGFLNIEHYYDHLIAFIDHMIGQQFLSKKDLEMIFFEEDEGRLLETFQGYDPFKII